MTDKKQNTYHNKSHKIDILNLVHNIIKKINYMYYLGKLNC